MCHKNRWEKIHYCSLFQRKKTFFESLFSISSFYARTLKTKFVMGTVMGTKGFRASKSWCMPLLQKLLIRNKKSFSSCRYMMVFCPKHLLFQAFLCVMCPLLLMWGQKNTFAPCFAQEKKVYEIDLTHTKHLLFKVEWMKGKNDQMEDSFKRKRVIKYFERRSDIYSI